MLRIIPRIIGPITVHQVSLINQCQVQRRGDTQMKKATKILASSTKMRNSFALLIAVSSWFLSCRRLTMLVLNQLDALRASCRNQLCLNGSTSCFDTLEFHLQWFGACGLRSPICPSHGHISSLRPTSNIFLRNFSSRMNQSWIPKKCLFLHFFWSEFAMKYSWSPCFFP